MIQRYLDDLARELRRNGIRGRTHARILLEVDDHLRSDDEALARFGDAATLAAGFRDELAAPLARSSAYRAFGALAAAGIAYAVGFLTFSPQDIFAARHEWLGALAGLGLVVAPQVSFVAGGLALVRALRRPADVGIVARRSGVGLLGGLATVFSLALAAYEFPVSGWWSTYAYAAASATALLMLTALPAVVRAGRLRVAAGPTDVFDDLGFRADPWQFARLVAGGVGLLVVLAGVIAGDGLDGAVRGLAEAFACFAGYLGLGRYLGLRR